MLYNTHKRICRECRAIANATIWEKITKSQMHHHNIAAYIVYMHTFGYCGYLPPKNWILSGNSWCQTVLWARCVCVAGALDDCNYEYIYIVGPKSAILVLSEHSSAGLYLWWIREEIQQIDMVVAAMSAILEWFGFRSRLLWDFIYFCWLFIYVFIIWH